MKDDHDLEPERQEALEEELRRDKGRDRLWWVDFVAGWGAGYVNVVVTYPIQKVLFRQMLHGIPAIHAVEQIRKEGLRLLYRGVLPPLCQKTVGTSIMFGLYETYGLFLVSKYPKLNHHVARNLGGALAGINEGLVLSPFERIQTLLSDKNYNSKLSNTYHAVRHLKKHHGIREFYRGTSVIMFRNSVGNIIFFSAKEKTKSLLPQTNHLGTKVVGDFISGGVIGAATSTIYYPLNVIKARMQSRLGGPFESPLSALKSVLEERGGKISEMYRGVHLNYTRSLLSWGITNASYELISLFMYRLSNERKPGS